MAKVDFNKLSRGQPLTPAAVWDNLDQAAAALSGNVSADQRAQSRSTFSVMLHRVRFSDAISGAYALNSGVGRPRRFAFQLPPLQEFFSSSLVSGASTPDIVLESLVVSFDAMNQEKPVLLDTGAPSSASDDVFNRDLEVTVETGTNIAKVSIPLSVLSLKNDEATNKPNPAVSAYIGASIGAYESLKVTVVPPIEIDYNTVPALAPGVPTGVDNLVIHAVFSAPVVQRDHSAHTVLPQNAPLHDCSRSPIYNVLTRPASGSLIKASSGTFGVQDAFSQLDRQVRDKLTGGLTRWSEVRSGAESLLEDQGYFCWMIPLFNVAEDEGLSHDDGLSPVHTYNSVTGYARHNVDTGFRGLMDKAVIPITAPGTIHHVGLFWDKILPAPAFQAEMDFGLALGCKGRSEVAEYTQVSYTQGKNVTYDSANNFLNSFYSPVAYSTAPGAPPLGNGYVQQGRPFFFGREIDYTGGTRRRDAAFADDPTKAEGASSTNGTETFLEVRCNINVTVAGAYADINNAFVKCIYGNGSGVMVCIYGKMALVD